MTIYLAEDAAELRKWLVEAVKKYAAKHAAPKSAKHFPAVARLDLNFWLTDGGPALPFIYLHIDTRENSEPDGTSTHRDFAFIERPGWQAAFAAVLDNKPVKVMHPDRSETSLTTANLESTIGNFLIAVLKSAQTAGVFQQLPRLPRCELGVEESGGSFAWPKYEDRGKDNLA